MERVARKEKKKDNVIEFKTRPWDEEKPCVECEIGKPMPELAELCRVMEEMLDDIASVLQNKVEALIESEYQYDHQCEKKCEACIMCPKFAEWKGRMDYWEDRKMKVRMGTWRTEDDEGSEREINGEADEERDKEADAED